MNPMQELAIKYPTLWDHIAKGGKVRGICSNRPKPIIGELSRIFATRDNGESDDQPFCVADYWCEAIELLPLPKRVPTKDLGKAVNWFENKTTWANEGGVYRNNVLDCAFTFDRLRDIVVRRIELPDWWPEELMEDEE